MKRLEGASIALGVGGGVAAYKAVELMRRLIDEGAYVTPILTANSLNFVGITTFRALASTEPITSLFNSESPIPHTKVGQSVDVVVVAPATADILSKFAQGACDDALSTILVSTDAKVILAAAMHKEMWAHPAVVENVATIRRRGFIVVDPEHGRLAGGDVGFGRLASTETIIDTVVTEVGEKDLFGKTVVVTVGGTREAIDPVRYIGNRSSGRQGLAIVSVLLDRGANVVAITSVDLDVASNHLKVIRVESALDMEAATRVSCTEADALIMCAAVADYRVEAPLVSKFKRGLGSLPELKLVENPDILAGVVADSKSFPQKFITVGFAAETDEVELNGRVKIAKKGCDILVVNDVSKEETRFGSVDNEVVILFSDGTSKYVPLAPKREIAVEVVNALAVRL